MNGLEQIQSPDRAEFSLSEEFPGWLDYAPKRETYKQDLEILRRYQDIQIIVTLHLKTKYTPWGFNKGDWKLIEDFLSFQGVRICVHFENLDQIACKSNIRLLSLFDYVDSDYEVITNFKMDLSKLHNLEFLWCPILKTRDMAIQFSDCKSLRFLFVPFLEGKCETNVSNIQSLSNLEYLSLHKPALSSLQEFHMLSKIRGLEIDYARNLDSLEGVECWSNVEFLDLQNCSNVVSIKSLENAKKLKLLRLWNCPKISSLLPLSDLNLECLDFYESKILDGELSFLENLKSLKHLRFSNRKNFNLKLDYFLDFGDIKEADLSILRNYYRVLMLELSHPFKAYVKKLNK